jgi:tungstate transport system substrate-binding protein
MPVAATVTRCPRRAVEFLLRRTVLPLSLALAACGGGGPRLLLGATHTLEDSGLLDVLLEAYDRTSGATGQVQAIVAGSGEILEYGRRGDLDVLIAHSPADEQAFMEEGHGLDRRAVLWNEFVLLGPPADPAGVAGAVDAAEAFRRVASSGARFVSRGDNSGTNRRELELWEAAGARPAPDRYVEAGAGMADALRVASSQGAYILADLATWRVLRDELDLAEASRGDPRLLNVYSVIRLAGARNAEGARRFAEWLGGARARAVIAAFGAGSGGPQLFRPGAPPGSG